METITFREFTDDSFPLFVTYAPVHRGYPTHNHEFTELVIVFDGTGVHMINDEEYTIRGGDVFVINPPIAHAYRETGTTELANILFAPEQLGIPIDELRSIPGYYSLFLLEPRLRKTHEFKSRVRINYATQAQLKPLIHNIRHELAEKQPGYRAMATAAFTELLTILCRNVVENPHKNYQSVYEFAKVLSYLEQHFAEPVTLEQLARLANMSKRSFQRQFKEAINLSPIDYLLKLRLQHAENLLHQTPRPISDIAFACGFTDSNYFSRQFRQKTGLSPSAFRQKTISELEPFQR